jgi:hypothetical protein
MFVYKSSTNRKDNKQAWGFSLMGGRDILEQVLYSMHKQKKDQGVLFAVRNTEIVDN